MKWEKSRNTLFNFKGQVFAAGQGGFAQAPQGAGPVKDVGRARNIPPSKGGRSIGHGVK